MGGRIVNVCVVVATGVNADGQREILGMDVGASGVKLVTSNAHQGLKNAIATVFAGANWQRCRPTSWPTCSPECPSVPNLAWPPWYAPSTSNCLPREVHGQLDRVVEQLREPFPQVAELLADAAPDLLAFTAFPVAHWQKLRSNNPQERLNREIRRRRACPRKGTWWASSPTGCRRGGW